MTVAIGGPRVGVANVGREVLKEMAPGLSARLRQNGRQLLAINQDHITRSSCDRQLLVCGEVTHRQAPLGDRITYIPRAFG